MCSVNIVPDVGTYVVVFIYPFAYFFIQLAHG